MLAPDALSQNRYLILSPAGQGGMGAVYEARDQRLGDQIALKETFFEDEQLRKAFEREARLLAGLRHPALPRVIDHFTEEAAQFLVTEFIPGRDLEAMLEEQKPVREETPVPAIASPTPAIEKPVIEKPASQSNDAS
ncbi:MAG TPA: protein kinase [Pyrinomonadaceae bacterium]|jgi:serine/threonine protein kinase